MPVFVVSAGVQPKCEMCCDLWSAGCDRSDRLTVGVCLRCLDHGEDA